MKINTLMIGDVIYDKDELVCIITKAISKNFVVMYFNGASKKIHQTEYKQVPLTHKYVFLGKLRKHGYCWNKETMQIEHTKLKQKEEPR